MAGLSLSVPLKTSADIDYRISLKKQFNKTTEMETAVIELNKMRSAFTTKNTLKSQATLESLYRYHDQLTALSNKLPEAAEMQFSFTWENALEKGSLFGAKSQMGSPSLAFEKICILFNIAALQSFLGSECSETDEELKSAAKLFQSAAGIFNELSAIKLQMAKNDQTVTSDLTEDTLSALSALMLAQAQEMFVTKAIKGAMKDAIIAKLSVQAVDLFADALKKMTKDSVRHVWDRTWLPNVAGKQTGYEALANFFQSKVCAANKRIGEQISRLGFCLENLRKAQEKTGNTEFLSYYVSEGNRLKTEAQKDNDFIYHEPVPPSSNLPTIERVPTARLAKLLPVPETFSSNFVDLFEKCSLKSSSGIWPWSNSSQPSNPQPSSNTVVVPKPEITAEVAHQTPSQPSTSQEAGTSSPNTSPNSSQNNPQGDAASPTLTDILNTSVDMVGNYLHNYLFGKRRQQ